MSAMNLHLLGSTIGGRRRRRRRKRRGGGGSCQLGMFIMEERKEMMIMIGRSRLDKD
jgi:hypothetical protein